MTRPADSTPLASLTVGELRELMPLPNRLKVGFCGSKFETRLGQHRVTCPELVVLARWTGTRTDERRAHATLPGRVSVNEIFDVPNADDALMLLDGVLGERCQ